MVPIPTTENKVLDGERVTQEQLAFLNLQDTTQEEVITNLGNPNVIWEDARVFAYDWVVRQAIVVWAYVVPLGPYGGDGDAGIDDIPKRYSLLIQFDESGRVQDFDIAVRPELKSYGDFLKDWVSSRENAVPTDLQNLLLEVSE